MKIEWTPIGAVKPYQANPRRNDRAVESVAKSIKEFGFQQPIVVDGDGVIVVGHTRYKAARSLGLEQVPVVVADLAEDKLRAYRVADNKLNELAEWDDDLLVSELEAIISDGNEALTGFTHAELDELLNTDSFGDSAYTAKIDTPIYTPRGECPPLTDLVDTDHCQQLKLAIDAADIPEDVKGFLKMAADRHRVFDYQNIAEYYCHAPAAVQRLMEDSALVIIDINKAIEQGYVRLNEDLRQAYLDDHGGSNNA